MEKKQETKKISNWMISVVRTIPFRVDTLNNKSANSRGCFSFLVIPQQKN